MLAALRAVDDTQGRRLYGRLRLNKLGRGAMPPAQRSGVYRCSNHCLRIASLCTSS
jgi:hypothetical protein